jgi:uncharacterized Zn finger protein (UPF0148 family)
MAKFCNQCGGALPEGSKACPNCGTMLIAQTIEKPERIIEKPVQTIEKPEQTAEKPEQTAEKPVQTAVEPEQAAVEPEQAAEEADFSVSIGEKSIGFNVADEDNSSVNVAGKELKVALLLRIAAGSLLFIFALFPMYAIRFTLWGVTTSENLNGLNVIFRQSGFILTLIALILLMIPVALFLLFQFKKELEKSIPALKGNLFLASTGLCGAGVFGLIIFGAVVDNMSSGYATVLTIGYVLSMLIYLAAGAVSLMCLTAGKKKKD